MKSWLLRSFVVAVVTLTGVDPVLAESGFLSTWDQARKAYQNQDWEAATELYGEVARHNPEHGGVWRSLGFAYLRSGNYDDSIVSYERALATGLAPAPVLYDIACAHALAGRPDDALQALGLSYARGFVDDELVRSDADLRSLHDLARFREIVGWEIPGVAGREARWLADIGFLDRRFREVHWNPFAVLAELEYERGLAAIRGSISERTDLELRAAIQNLLARVGDGHTAVSSDLFQAYHGVSGVASFLPVEVFCFEDSVRITKTTAEFRQLAGARVMEIGGQKIDDVVGLVRPYVSSDNEWGARWALAQALVEPRLLEALGLGNREQGVRFRLRLLDGTVNEVDLTPGGSEVVRGLLGVGYWLGAAETPATRRKDQHLWIEELGDSCLYVRIDGIRDGHPESFFQFTNRVFTTAESSDAQFLALDLRDNPGGQGQLTPPFLHQLIASERFNRPGHLYLLVGRKTFSAAMAFAAQIELHTHALFVGEPTGSRPNFVGESSLVQLPYSRLWISVSSRYHQNGGSNDNRFWIPPDVPAVPTMADLQSGRDSALDAVLDLVRSGR